MENISINKLKHLIKLYNSKYQDEYNEFVVEGYHLVLEAYKTGNLLMMFKEENDTFSLNVETYIIDEKSFTKLSKLVNSKQVIGICKKLSNKGLVGNKYLLLDKIQDPGNLGTIIRSAKAFDIDTIVLGKGCVNLYNSKVLRATQGIIFHLNIIEDNLLDVIPKLKDKGVKILGTSLNGNELSKNYSTYALVMGNEGNGISSDIIALCEENIYIKINNEVESLNVAIATSIILYELNKR